jgi:putative ABC transport system permease protein
MVYGGVYLELPGYASGPWGDQLFAPSPAGTPGSDFYATNRFTFDSTWNGLDAAGVWSRLASNASYAVVDGNYAPSNAGNFGSTHPSALVGDIVKVTSSTTRASLDVTVIGVLSEFLVTGVFVGAGTAARLGYQNDSAYFLTVAQGSSTDRAAQQTKAAFLPDGLVLFDLAGLYKIGLGFTLGFVGLLQVFVGLGLAVGIASLGIVALPAVQERRSEIGMLRAAGFTQTMVFKSFLIEFSFITLLGILIGTSLGIVLILGLLDSPGAASSGITSISIPWWNLALVAATTYGLTILAIAGPSIRAARLPPAEAVRPTE